MSTNSECMFVEVKPGEWYYVLEDYDAPKNAWDWREYATAYGPFPTEDEARSHLSECHANPGGSSSAPFQGDGPKIDAVMQRLIDDAPRNMKAFSRGW